MVISAMQRMCVAESHCFTPPATSKPLAIPWLPKLRHCSKPGSAALHHCCFACRGSCTTICGKNPRTSTKNAAWSYWWTAYFATLRHQKHLLGKGVKLQQLPLMVPPCPHPALQQPLQTALLVFPYCAQYTLHLNRMRGLVPVAVLQHLRWLCCNLWMSRYVQMAAFCSLEEHVIHPLLASPLNLAAENACFCVMETFMQVRRNPSTNGRLTVEWGRVVCAGICTSEVQLWQCTVCCSAFLPKGIMQ